MGLRQLLMLYACPYYYYYYDYYYDYYYYYYYFTADRTSAEGLLATA